ncbi:DUF7373 family lipoprotein [Nocardia huaxiensis]|uniref:DUF7373 family lipoprotein n=1 Tax=Nocardia huaxiensis TaxID=2755382 RepID=UPI001E4B0440|nr:hypothetical protein [Nocardia huaxiensis]UFS95448.1 hypothetical protein LPY97_33000 [Nocardia huaxiensis]
MRIRFRRCAAAVSVAAITLVTAGCGGATKDSGAPLDFGPYSTQRPDSGYDDGASLVRGVLAESLRLGEYIVFGSEVSPDVAAERRAITAVGERGLSMYKPEEQYAAKPFHPYAGFTAESAETPYLGDHLAHYMLRVTLTAFPDEQSAAGAAAAMAAKDFGTDDTNTPVSIPDHPTALAHWIPAYAIISSWMAYKSVVISVYAGTRQPNLDQLTALTSNAYRQQVARLADYSPVKLDELPTLKLDPDKLLTRLVDTGDNRPDALEFAVYGPRTFALLTSSDPATDAREYSTRGVAAIAVSDNKHLFQFRDADAAGEFATYLIDAPTVSTYTGMAGVDGAADITCSRATQPDPTESRARRFRCVMTREGFVAVVFSDRDSDVRQLAAAQYALMRDGR